MINTKQFKKYLLKDVGKRCSTYCEGCFVCRSWKILDEMVAYNEFIEWIGKEDIKQARPHRKGRQNN